jgi:hypothetical protein
MHVGSDFEASGKLRSDDVTSLLCRIADDQRLLSTWLYSRRPGTPFDLIRLHNGRLLSPSKMANGQSASDGGKSKKTALHDTSP